ncbi:hypothetical protein Tco_1193949 [Tanacetum coccineum]
MSFDPRLHAYMESPICILAFDSIFVCYPIRLFITLGVVDRWSLWKLDVLVGDLDNIVQEEVWDMVDCIEKKMRVNTRRVRAMSMTIQSSVKDKILATSSETSKVENTPAEMLRNLDQQMEKRADDEIGESSLTGPELVLDMTDKVVLIKEKLKAARDHQKSYADNRRKPLEFEVGDRVMLKVSPWKGVICFGKKG